jgi:hypothetical protein
VAVPAPALNSRVLTATPRQVLRAVAEHVVLP